MYYISFSFAGTAPLASNVFVVYGIAVIVAAAAAAAGGILWIVLYICMFI